MRWRKKLTVKLDDGAVVNEALALLDGRVRTTTYSACRRPPAWVYVNQLAHASSETLASLAESRPMYFPATFDYAAALLADEILAKAAGKPLPDVQRALVALELGLLASASQAELTPATFFMLASHALADSGPSLPGASTAP